MQCPPDMLVFRAAPGEPNTVTISDETTGFQRTRFLVRDDGANLQAGAGCQQIDPSTVTCTAGVIGPVDLGDGDDRIAARSGDVSGGDGADVLNIYFGFMDGDGGGDVLIGSQGDGGAGQDLLLVSTGRGDAGDDILRCVPRDQFCQLDGGRGDDVVTGGTTRDSLFGRAGADLLRGLGGDDALTGGRGADILDCGAGRRDSADTKRRDRASGCERSN